MSRKTRIQARDKQLEVIVSRVGSWILQNVRYPPLQQLNFNMTATKQQHCVYHILQHVKKKDIQTNSDIGTCQTNHFKLYSLTSWILQDVRYTPPPPAIKLLHDSNNGVLAVLVSLSCVQSIAHITVKDNECISMNSMCYLCTQDK